MAGRRIVSLLPSATEIVAALGGLDQLVGRSHECDHPAEVESLPVCCHPTLDIQASGQEIDRQVKQRLAQAVSIFEIDHDLLSRLQPDLVLTQVLSLAPSHLAEVWQSVLSVGEALGHPDRASEIVSGLKDRMQALARTVEVAAGDLSPRIACIEWLEPLMVAGNWVPELVELAGGVDVLGTSGAHSPWISWSDLVAADPDVLVLMPCGFDIERTRTEWETLENRAQWHQLRSVAEGRVFITDGHQFFNRPGPRLVESAEILAEILHPGRCDFGHHPAGWQPA